jgi:predicted transcriptional regulator
MTTIQVKSQLHQLIDTIDDVRILNAIKLLLQKQVQAKENDFWENLPIEVKQSIERGIEQADNGELISHETVMEEIKNKYNF